MNVADAFKEFLSNIAIDNADTISLRYGEITAALNKQFRETESKTANSLQVGSYGRWTAIKGISDLDMLYIMPNKEWDNYKNGGQSRLLTATKDAISARYPTTDVSVDRLVVRVLYKDFHVEAQPVFEQEDGSFKYPDTYNGGSWKITKPREEILAISEFNDEKNNNLRRLCKMVRAWKNKHGVGMGGLLIDTFCYGFLKSTKEYDSKSYLYYDYMSRDFFLYLSERPKQDYFAALGSGQRVKVKSNFQKKAKKAYDLCLKAIDAAGKDTENDKWRKVFGSKFPEAAIMEKKASVASAARLTEEHIDDKFPIDIRYDVTLDCEITQNGFRPSLLRKLLIDRTPLLPKKKLRFFIDSINVPEPYTVWWKVLNRGPEAIRRDRIRGQIVRDKGGDTISETTDFRGDHVVDCYVVKAGVVVATDRIHVPISANAED